MKLTDDGFTSALRGVCVFTGEKAADDFEKKVSRVQAKRWGTFVHLLETARFFGTLVVLSHGDDPEVEGRAWSSVQKPEHGHDSRTVGLFHAWGQVEVTLCRLSTWKEVEDVLRHELTHLLQHAAGKQLLSSQVKGGKNLERWANLNGPHWAKYDHDPAEAEAYWLQTKPKRWKRWADEFRNSGKWVGWHYERDEAETSAAAESHQKCKRPECYVAAAALKEAGSWTSDDGWTVQYGGPLLNLRERFVTAAKDGQEVKVKGHWGSETVARCLSQARFTFPAKTYN